MWVGFKFSMGRRGHVHVRESVTNGERYEVTIRGLDGLCALEGVGNIVNNDTELLHLVDGVDGVSFSVVAILVEDANDGSLLLSYTRLFLCYGINN